MPTLPPVVIHLDAAGRQSQDCTTVLAILSTKMSLELCDKHRWYTPEPVDLNLAASAFMCKDQIKGRSALPPLRLPCAMQSAVCLEHETLMVHALAGAASPCMCHTEFLSIYNRLQMFFPKVVSHMYMYSCQSSSRVHPPHASLPALLLCYHTLCSGDKQRVPNC